MTEMTIKTRQPRPVEEVMADVDAAAGRQNVKPAGSKVIKLGAKERLNSYITPEQKRKLRLLAIERDCDMSKIVGKLIDEAKAPTL